MSDFSPKSMELFLFPKVYYFLNPELVFSKKPKAWIGDFKTALIRHPSRLCMHIVTQYGIYLGTAWCSQVTGCLFYMIALFFDVNVSVPWQLPRSCFFLGPPQSQSQDRPLNLLHRSKGGLPAQRLHADLIPYIICPDDSLEVKQTSR